MITGGSDNHLLLVDVKSSCGKTGKEAEKLLGEVNITVNKNAIPYDSEKPFTTSGIRLCSAAMTTKGYNEDDFYKIGKLIASVLKDDSEANVLRVKQEVKALTSVHPFYEKA